MPAPTRDRAYRPRHAFTLIELLVVIIVIAILAALLFSGLARSMESAGRAKCVSQLKNISAALTTYASENNQNLPRIVDKGWLRDMDFGTRDTLLKYGLTRDVFYCPSNPTQNVDSLWNYPSGTETSAGWCANTYFWLLQNAYFNRSPGLLGGKQYVYTLLTDKLASTEVVTDMVMGRSGNFKDGVTAGNQSMISTNHFFGGARGNKPEGGNILYLDGHVAWRNFADMKLRRNNGGVEQWY
jgi:prepilin-type N-terminal cleavage/methylation domain-containing protein/prepilin-type processing-associated H-X9-DG protein